MSNFIENIAAAAAMSGIFLVKKRSAAEKGCTV
jgi:hypothetical protein